MEHSKTHFTGIKQTQNPITIIPLFSHYFWLEKDTMLIYLPPLHFWPKKDTRAVYLSLLKRHQAIFYLTIKPSYPRSSHSKNNHLKITHPRSSHPRRIHLSSCHPRSSNWKSNHSAAPRTNNYGISFLSEPGIRMINW